MEAVKKRIFFKKIKEEDEDIVSNEIIENKKLNRKSLFYKIIIQLQLPPQ